MEDSLAKGFIKDYAGSKYAFAALLPNEGVILEDYVAQLDGEHLHSLLESVDRSGIEAVLPKFNTEFTVSLAPRSQSHGHDQHL